MPNLLLTDPIASADIETERPFWPAVRRGWAQRCPCCGQGAVFDGYVSVRHNCIVCDEDLHHQRADDGPAYLTIMVVGKVMTGVMYSVFVAFRPEPIYLAAGFALGAVVLSLYLLPRFKGALIAVQWAKRMHGFGAAPK